MVLQNVPAPRPLVLRTVDIPRREPSRDREAREGPIIVWDRQTGSLTVVGERNNTSTWVSGPRLLTFLGDELALYEPAGRTWQVIDGIGAGKATDPAPRVLTSRNGSRAAIHPEVGLFTLLDFASMTSQPLPLDAYPADWSPDGTRLALRQQRPSPRVGPPLARITWLEASNPAVLRALPDGEFVLWLDNTRVAIWSQARRFQIVDVSAPGGRVLTDEQIASDQLSISPDGRMMAVGDRTVMAKPNVLIHRLQPFALTRTIPGASLGNQLDVSRHIWSRDGERVLLLRETCTSAERLVSIEVNTGSEAPLAIAAPYYTLFSPDGRWVVYTAGTELYVVPSDASTPPALVFQPAHGPAPPAWSSDSRFVSFARFYGGYGRC